MWTESIELVADVYSLTEKFPKSEEFGLKSQMKRAAVSVPSNIAEGLSRRTSPDKLNFLFIANGSLSEIDAQIEIAKRLQFITDEEKENLEKRLIKVQKLLSGLIRNIKSK